MTAARSIQVVVSAALWSASAMATIQAIYRLPPSPGPGGLPFKRFWVAAAQGLFVASVAMSAWLCATA